MISFHLPAEVCCDGVRMDVSKVSRLVFKFDPVRFIMRDPPVHAALIPRTLNVNGKRSGWARALGGWVMR